MVLVMSIKMVCIHLIILGQCFQSETVYTVYVLFCLVERYYCHLLVCSVAFRDLQIIVRLYPPSCYRGLSASHIASYCLILFTKVFKFFDTQVCYQNMGMSLAKLMAHYNFYTALKSIPKV